MSHVPESDGKRTGATPNPPPSSSGVFATPPHPIGWIVRSLVVIGGLIVALPVFVRAMFSTAFAGTPNGMPAVYLYYLGATQALPLAVAAVAWLAFLVTFRKGCLKILCVAAVVYAASWLGVLFIPWSR